jgi:hypothetical protein
MWGNESSLKTFPPTVRNLYCKTWRIEMHREGTAYIDHAGGRWEAWHNAEGRRWELGFYAGREDAIQQLRKQFARIVDCTYRGNDGGHIIR